MSSKHRDPWSGPVQRPSTRRSQTGPKGETSSERTSAKVGHTGGSRPSLLVTRELQKVLEQEMRENSTPQKRSTPRGAAQASRPKFLFCYLCGQQFSSTSLPIHQPQCHVKKLIEWERMDPAKRGPRPLDPAEHEAQMKDMGQFASGGMSNEGKMKGKQVDLFNEMQIDHFNKIMLLKCENCMRTFLPDRLEVHQRSCKKGSVGASRPVSRPSRGRDEKGVSEASVGEGGSDSKKLLSEARTEAEGSEPASHGEREVRGDRASTVPSSKERTTCSSLQKKTPSDRSSESVESCRDPWVSTLPGIEDVISGTETTAAFTPVDNNKKSNSAVVSTTVYIDASKDDYDEFTGEVKQPETSLHASSKEGSTMREVISAKRCKSPSINSTPSESLLAPRRVGSQVERGMEEGTAGPQLDESPDLVDACLRDLDACGEEAMHPKHSAKIPLNNVSRFKNVQSRVKQEVQKQEQLPRCCYCNRTFNADRIGKHEDVCLERNKPQRRVVTPKLSATTNITNTTTTTTTTTIATAGASASGLGSTGVVEALTPLRTKKNSSTKKQQTTVGATIQRDTTKAAGTSSPTVVNATSENGEDTSKKDDVSKEGTVDPGDKVTRQRFCMECGGKLYCEAQRFCAHCGAKLLQYI